MFHTRIRQNQRALSAAEPAYTDYIISKAGALVKRQIHKNRPNGRSLVFLLMFVQRLLGMGAVWTGKIKSSTSPRSPPRPNGRVFSSTAAPPLCQQRLSLFYARGGEKMREKAFQIFKNFTLTRPSPCGIINPALGNAFLSCRSGGIGRRPGLKILCSIKERAGSIPVSGTSNHIAG